MKKFGLAIYVLIICAFLIRITVDYFLGSKSPNNQYSKEVEAKKYYDIFIDLEEHRLNLFENEILIRSYPIASGKQDTPSPAGIWKIIDKSRWGNGFGGYWMKLNVPWGIYGIHGTSHPESIGHNASHGCIRMFSYDAKELYSIVPIGTTVVISNGPYGAFSRYNRTIMPGDRGSDVLEVQRALKKFGFYNGGLDGIYGETMKKALFEFQKFKGCSPHNEITRSDLNLMGLGQFE